MTENEKKLWLAIYWLAMKIDRICPMCQEKLESGKVKHGYLVWHLKEEHPELLTSETPIK